ncbi:type II toxin-antitoxin system RelE/ParE family toxin [Sphingobium yanoikuyae]|uniref:type II toxin-antitoxin system RelE/ParE family toxin n=1 Tax=Sphingobium yanoikuyae TaxID=13690 RepID=UPI000262C81D|nr:type II toxin-antitoxin system RelE/ParE family toxin [Sphingobium yanoikuyae]
MILQFSPAAEADLVDIAMFIAADDANRALTFVDELQSACDILVDYPLAGVARPELCENLRSKPYRRYMIYYRIVGDAVRIERFLHGSRDPSGMER